MSYIYSQALVGASSRGSCLDTEQSALSSGSHTRKPCLWHDKTMEHSRLSRFGMTCKPLTEDLGAELLISWRAGFHAKTSASPETAQALTESAAGCGTTWPASLAKYDPDTSLWKTAQRSLLEDWAEFSETWPRWGLMRNGECWERPTLVLRTSENASGLWQTPVADDAANRAAGKWNSRGEPKLSAQVMWPTPTRDSATERTSRYAQGGLPLTAAVHHWPTPTVCGNHNRKGLTKSSGDGLATAVNQRTYPTATATATATAYKGWSPKHNRADTDDRLDYTIEREAYSHGQQTPPMRLNPAWVEWLMGWPIGHTELKPLETDRFQEWQQQHGNC